MGASCSVAGPGRPFASQPLAVRDDLEVPARGQCAGGRKAQAEAPSRCFLRVSSTYWTPLGVMALPFFVSWA